MLFRKRTYSVGCTQRVDRIFLRLVATVGILMLYKYYTLPVKPWFDSAELNFNPGPIEVEESQFFKVPLAKACVYTSCLNESSPNNGSSANMTIVTAYFDIGSFRKGNTEYFSSNLYKYWMSSYKLVSNDVLMFSDEQYILDLFAKFRQSANLKTCFCLVPRESIWSFRMIPAISKALNQTGYPRYSPNTVLPEYGAAMHSKYALMELALEWNPFGAEYFAWADLGIYRLLAGLTDSEPPFQVVPPVGFDNSRVAFTQIDEPNFQQPVVDVFKRNLVWVGGGFFIATRQTMSLWIEQYKTTAIALLQRGLSSTDQQVIYAMYNVEMRQELTTERSLLRIQTFHGQPKVDKWFYLPFLSRLDWFRSVKNEEERMECTRITLRLEDCSKRSYFELICYYLNLCPDED